MVAVDAAKPTVTLDHGPIPGLMPAMRMEFPAQPDVLTGLERGDQIRFSLQARGPEWVVVNVERVSPSAPPRPVTFEAPDFTLPTLGGGPFRLAEVRGKVVLLNFWAPWCVPCRTEMPALEALYWRYRERGLEVVGVNLDKLSTDGVTAFLKEVPVTFRIVLDPAWSLPPFYRVAGLPTTYLIDRAGNVVVREIGGRDWDDEVSRAAVEALVRESSGASPR